MNEITAIAKQKQSQAARISLVSDGVVISKKCKAVQIRTFQNKTKNTNDRNKQFVILFCLLSTFTPGGAAAGEQPVPVFIITIHSHGSLSLSLSHTHTHTHTYTPFAIQCLSCFRTLSRDIRVVSSLEICIYPDIILSFRLEDC